MNQALYQDQLTVNPFSGSPTKNLDNIAGESYLISKKIQGME
jgi:hypothetical protein